jgi:hypothetical protein
MQSAQGGPAALPQVYEGALQQPGGGAPLRVAVLRVRSGTCAAEARTLAKLGRHARLVRFLGQCAEGGAQLLVTEFAPLGGLDALVQRLADRGAALSAAHQLAVLRQVCAGMAELAAEQVVHRDLALRNILAFALGAARPSPVPLPPAAAENPTPTPPRGRQTRRTRAGLR